MHPPKSYFVFRWIVGGLVLLIGVAIAVTATPSVLDLFGLAGN